MLAGASNLFPEYDRDADSSEKNRGYISAIEDSSFSPEVKAAVAGWHRRSADLLDSMDAMLARRRQQVDQHFETCDRRLAEARAILLAIRSALEEVIDGGDPLGEAVQRVKLRLPPLAPAASDAVCDLSDQEISAVRALKHSPPPVVRTVVCCVCTLLKLKSKLADTVAGTTAASGGSATAAIGAAPLPLASWEEGQAMLARPDFAKALRGFDPRDLNMHPPTAKAIKSRLASLGAESSSTSSGGGTARAGLMRARAQLSHRTSSSASIGGVAGTAMMLKVAVRSGGRAVGQLYLWCARVLAEAEDRKLEEELERAQEEESSALAGVLEQAQASLEEAEIRLEEAR